MSALPAPVHERTLDSGLRLVVIPFESPGVMAFHTVVRTGSRDEVEPGRSGFAHFFEHMMFRGTHRWPERAYSDVLRRLGAQSNAYTTDDYTCYHIVCGSYAMETVMDIESDRFQHLDYAEDAFRTEALAVHGEYKMGASNPWQPMMERVRELAFQRHTYGHTTIGYERDIRTMPDAFAYSRDFFQRFYRPGNCTLLVVGDVEPDAVVSSAERWYGAWQGAAASPDVQPEPPQDGERRAHLGWASTRPRLVMGWRGPAFADPRSPALAAVEQLLFGAPAPLYQELVVERQWVDALSASPPFHRDPYLFTVWAQPRDAALLGPVELAIRRHLERLQTELVDPDRLERVKDHIHYSFATGLDSAATLAQTASVYLGVAGEVGAIDAFLGQVGALTPDAVRDAARALTTDGLTVVTLASEEAP
ncbi:MAG: zinc protease [Myxococcales bacterium]